MAAEPLTKGGRSRQAVKDAAREALREHGYALSRVQDIARRAGLSNGAFYRYYANKRDVTVEILRDLLADAFALTAGPDGRDPGEAITAGTARYLSFYEANSALFRVLIELAQTDAEVEAVWADIRSNTIARLSRSLRKGIDTGTFRADLDTDLAATLLTAMTDHYSYLRFILDRAPHRSIQQACDEITSVWFRGIAAGERPG